MEKQLHVYQAISEVTSKLAKDGISKDRKNLQQGYSFRGIDDIYNALSKAISEAGLTIIPRILHRELKEATTKSGGALFYVTVEAEYDFVSSKDGSMHTAKVFGEAMDSADKATNKAMSAAYKYLCLQTFCIPTEGDNDADNSTPEVKGLKSENTPVENNKPGLGDAGFKKLLDRVKSGETGAADKAMDAFNLTPQQRDTLAAAYMEFSK